MSSAGTLEEFVMLPSIFPLCHFPVVLMKLKKLRMFAGWSEAQQVLTVLRSITYSRSFPALEQVELTAEGQSEGSPQGFVNPWEGRQVEAQLEPVITQDTRSYMLELDADYSSALELHF